MYTKAILSFPPISISISILPYLAKTCLWVFIFNIEDNSLAHESFKTEGMS